MRLRTYTLLLACGLAAACGSRTEGDESAGEFPPIDDLPSGNVGTGDGGDPNALGGDGGRPGRGGGKASAGGRRQPTGRGGAVGRAGSPSSGGRRGSGGASSGGFPTSGGGAIVCPNDDRVCAAISISSPVPLNACCTGRGRCGIDFSVLEQFGVGPTCQEVPVPGVEDRSCAPTPDFPLVPCCREDATCGVDLSSVGLGCIRLSRDGAAVRCGAPGTGGRPGTGGAASQDACIDQARSDCEACTCKSCFSEMTACYGDEGCPEILSCVNVTGCIGSECIQPDTCGAVIDSFGGFSSPSTTLASNLAACLVTSRCDCGFAF